MKIHPALLALLVLCALAGAFAVGRMGRTQAAAPAVPAVEPAAPARLVTIGPTQSAEIKTDGETLRIEGSASILPSPSAPDNP